MYHFEHTILDELKNPKNDFSSDMDNANEGSEQSAEPRAIPTASTSRCLASELFNATKKRQSAAHSQFISFK
jgi:hypothetical protein